MIINGVDLFYRDIGYGQVVILLHGYRQSSRLFLRLGKRLAEHYRVIAIDSRGHGKSGQNTEPFSISLMSEDVIAVMDELKIKDAIIIGFSDGGNIALQIAVDHPERLRRIVTISANARPEGLVLIFRLAIKLWKFMLWILTFSTDRLNLLIKYPQITDEQLSGITVPTLLVYGTGDIIQKKHMKLLNELIPRSEMLMVNGAGHGTIMRMWRRYEKNINEFVKAEYKSE